MLNRSRDITQQEYFKMQFCWSVLVINLYKCTHVAAICTHYIYLYTSTFNNYNLTINIIRIFITCLYALLNTSGSCVDYNIAPTSIGQPFTYCVTRWYKILLGS